MYGFCCDLKNLEIMDVDVDIRRVMLENLIDSFMYVVYIGGYISKGMGVMGLFGVICKLWFGKWCNIYCKG